MGESDISNFMKKNSMSMPAGSHAIAPKVGPDSSVAGARPPAVPERKLTSVANGLPAPACVQVEDIKVCS